jgi:PPOX class probable F420-dependent enzyme
MSRWTPLQRQRDSYARGKERPVTTDEAREFVASNHRAVLVTRRASGGLQTSPVLVVNDPEGHVVVSSRETAYKTRNLRRDPAATVTVLNDGFFGDWIRIDGTAEIVSLPDAMEGLIDYFRRISGEHPDWDEYRQAMKEEQRVLIRISIDVVGPTQWG